MSKSHLELSAVGISFPTDSGPYCALQNVNLKIAKGEFVSLIGHSGCGKSTVLNIVAGLYRASTGGVILDGREVDSPGPERAVVFQNHSLLPWLTVYENVKLAVDKVFAGKKSKAERHDWIMQNLDLVQMGHATDKRPSEISGGMKQRVEVARALAVSPDVIYMDEPFGAIDPITRDRLQNEFLRLQGELKKTIVFVTHDIDEAIKLGDQVAVLRVGGTLAQLATPADLLSRPVDSFVAGFVGTSGNMGGHIWLFGGRK